MSDILSEEQILCIENSKFSDERAARIMAGLIYTLRFWREQAEIAREDRDQYKEKYEKLLVEGVSKELETFKQQIIMGLGIR
jgi:hypothetical protein